MRGLGTVTPPLRSGAATRSASPITAGITPTVVRNRAPEAGRRPRRCTDLEPALAAGQVPRQARPTASLFMTEMLKRTAPPSRFKDTTDRPGRRHVIRHDHLDADTSARKGLSWSVDLCDRDFRPAWLRRVALNGWGKRCSGHLFGFGEDSAYRPQYAQARCWPGSLSGPWQHAEGTFAEQWGCIQRCQDYDGD